MLRPLLEHDVVRPGQLWKSTHAVLLPRNKLIRRVDETIQVTHVMVVHLEARQFDASYDMNYVEVWLLTEDEDITSLKFMNNAGENDNHWLTEFYRYCQWPDAVL